jgi:hypothetical protein
LKLAQVSLVGLYTQRATSRRGAENRL